MDADNTSTDHSNVLPFKKPQPKPVPKRGDRVDRTTHRIFEMYGRLSECVCIDCRFERLKRTGSYAAPRPLGGGA